MSYEVNNTLRNASLIRAEGPGTYTITLANLSSNSALETVSSASIKRMNWTSNTNGSITVARGATPNILYSLYGTGELRLDEYAHASANGSTGNIVVTIASAGSLTMEVSKVATYSRDLGTI
jgi:hypothetical protein